MRLWETVQGRPRRPVLVKSHSHFVGGKALVIVGTRWSRTFGLLPKGEQMFADFPHTWLGGMSWRIRTKQKGKHTLTRPRLAVCKWRYR